jgi:hypothetical protein
MQANPLLIKVGATMRGLLNKLDIGLYKRSLTGEVKKIKTESFCVSPNLKKIKSICLYFKNMLELF